MNNFKMTDRQFDYFLAAVMVGFVVTAKLCGIELGN